MARGPSARVVLNRQALDQAILAVADGFAEAAKLSIEIADPPDRTPYGVGLTKRGGYLAYVNGKKIAGGGRDGRQPKKPRAVNARDGIVVVAGFGFPGRFQELGTVHHGAQPFLTPVMLAIKPQIPAIVARQVAARGIGRRP